jgi:mycothiol synthase
MDLPIGLSCRPATFADAAAVLEVVNAAQAVDIGETLLELSDIEADWASPSLDPTEDVILVHQGDRLVAYAQVSGSRADADVHPDVRGRGVGRCLVEWTERRAFDRAAPRAEVRIGQTVRDGLEGTEDLFVARGYERLWDSWILRLPPNADLGSPSVPDGTTIRPFLPEEEAAVYTLIDDAFNEWEGRESTPIDEWRSMTIARSDFDPSLLLVTTIGEKIVGAALGIHYPGEGWVDQIAVDRRFRDRGIAKALLTELLGRFREQGETRLGLNTDSRTGALGLYLAIGMVVEHTFVRWSRLLRPAAE